MLAELIKIISPDALIEAIKANPQLVLTTLNKFDAYSAFGSAMSTEQQMAVSTQLGKLGAFFRTDAGKAAVNNMASEFVRFTTV